MTDDNPDAIDWSLTTWEGNRRLQMQRWASLSLDQILEAQEAMADLCRELAGPRPQRAESKPAPTPSMSLTPPRRD